MPPWFRHSYTTVNVAVSGVVEAVDVVVVDVVDVDVEVGVVEVAVVEAVGMNAGGMDGGAVARDARAGEERVGSCDWFGVSDEFLLGSHSTGTGVCRGTDFIASASSGCDSGVLTFTSGGLIGTRVDSGTETLFSMSPTNWTV